MFALPKRVSWPAVVAANVALGLLVVAVQRGNTEPTYVYRTIDPPGSDFFRASGINNAGQIVESDRFASFLFDGSSYTRIMDVNGASGTAAGGINASGDIVGSYGVGVLHSIVHGFLLSGGSYTTLDPPGSLQTNAFGINDARQIV